MTKIRSAAVAGMFYPADPQHLRSTILDMLALADDKLPLPKAIIAPHAGYIYSGPIAAQAYACLTQATTKIRQVVLIGPAHNCPCYGVVAPDADAFETPLGLVKIDQQAISKIAAKSQLTVSEVVHADEHCLEVQLPFLQLLLKNFTIVPLLVGVATPEEIALVLSELWNGPETLIVVSSDLSHYHNYQTAKKMDQAAADAILKLDPEALINEHACGNLPIKGLLTIAKVMQLKAKLIALANSGDTAGTKDQVVGYGAFHFA